MQTLDTAMLNMSAALRLHHAARCALDDAQRCLAECGDEARSYFAADVSAARREVAAQEANVKGCALAIINAR